MSPDLALQGATVLAAALVMSLVARRSSAELHRDALGAALLATLALPLLGMMPAIAIPVALPPTVTPLLASLPAGAGLALQEPGGVGEAGSALHLGSILTGAWALGVGVASARLIAGHVRAWRLGAGSVPLPADWRGPVGRVAPAVPVRAHASIDTPLLVGILRPCILVPLHGDGTPAERERALLHESAHARNHDNLRLFVGELARCLRWFDPLAWVALGRMRLAMEQVADAAVLRSGARGAEYADDLLRLARTRQRTGALPAAASLGGPPLARRVRAVLGARSAPTPASFRAAAGLLIGAVSLGVALPLVGQPAEAAVSPGAADVQSVVDVELARLVQTWHPEAAAIVVVDLQVGGVVAVAEHGAGAADRRWASGSVVKPFVAVAALDAGTAPSMAALGDALETSSNPAFVALASSLGVPALGPAMRAQGFSEAAGATPAELALGQFPTSTRELARAYAGLGETQSGRTVRSLLTRVVEGGEGTGRAAAVPGRTVAGKTGTAVMGAGAGPDAPVLASFVGLVPADDPRWSIAVQVAAPAPRSWGGRVAAPAFAGVVAGLP